MPTPLGHTLTGLAVWAVARKPVSIKDAMTRENAGWAALCVLAANLPDADFIYFAGGTVHVSGKYHHGITHSIGFAAAMAAMTGLWAWGRKIVSNRPEAAFAPNPALAAMVMAIGALIHITLDFLNVDSNPENGIGMPFFWPFSGEYMHIPILGGVDRTKPLSFQTVIYAAKEAVIFGTALALALVYARGKASAPARPAREEATLVAEEVTE